MKRKIENRSAKGQPLLVTAILLLGTSFAHGNQAAPLPPADADTAAAHQSSSAYYLEQAEDARIKADEHRKLYDRYIERGLTIVARHCAAIADRFEEIAQSYEAIAKGHENLSEDGKTGISDLHNSHTPDKPSQ